MGRRVIPPKRVTSPTWGPPPPCKQALNQQQLMQKADMPGLVESFFEIHKTGIDLFRVIMNPLNVVSIKVRSVKTWSAVQLFSKKPICDL